MADVEACALSNDEILTAITESLRAQGNGLTVIEPRVHLIPKSSADGHFNVLRGVVDPLGLAGIKVVGDFVDNDARGLPSEMAPRSAPGIWPGRPRRCSDTSARPFASPAEPYRAR